MYNTKKWDKVKVHLGCGQNFIEGFKYVDLLDFTQDNNIDMIYATHVLEHFGRLEYKDILKQNDILRVSVPSFESVVEYYNNHDDNLELLLGLLIGGQYDYHKMIFDKKLLTKDLQELGFKSVSLHNWK